MVKRQSAVDVLHCLLLGGHSELVVVVLKPLMGTMEFFIIIYTCCPKEL